MKDILDSTTKKSYNQAERANRVALLERLAGLYRSVDQTDPAIDAYREMADVDEFLKVWDSQTRAFAVMDSRTFNNFKERGVPMRTVGQNVGKVMVARQ